VLVRPLLPSWVPPAISTLPLGNSVAVAQERPPFIKGVVAAKVLLAGDCKLAGVGAGDLNAQAANQLTGERIGYLDALGDAGRPSNPKTTLPNATLSGEKVKQWRDGQPAAAAGVAEGAIVPRTAANASARIVGLCRRADLPSHNKPEAFVSPPRNEMSGQDALTPSLSCQKLLKRRGRPRVNSFAGDP
jgi:hypothetical protein